MLWQSLPHHASLKDDIIHAGAHYQDEEVVVDGNLITSRMPADLPAEGREIISALQQVESLV